MANIPPLKKAKKQGEYERPSPNPFVFPFLLVASKWCHIYRIVVRQNHCYFQFADKWKTGLCYDESGVVLCIK